MRGQRAKGDRVERNRELEAVLVCEPEDTLGYLAFAEWLKERGDPWGELIEAQVEAHEAALEQDEGERIADLRARVIADLRRREPALDDLSLDDDELDLWWGFADIFEPADSSQEALRALRDPFFLLTSCLDFSGATISDLSPLADLARLKELYLSETEVSDLSPLAGLVHLKLLDLQETRVADLGPLAGLTALENLNLSGTRVRDLKPLMGLGNLTDLDLSDTPVKPAQIEALEASLPDVEIEY